MTINLAVGAPTTMLSDLCSLGGIELCFAHLLSEGPTPYRAYYERERAAGRFIILDNGIMERGVAASVEEILKVTFDLQPSLVTPPEVLHDARETLRHAKDFAQHIGWQAMPLGTKMLGIAHGSSFDEWCRCFEGLVALAEVARIGIPYDVPFDVETSTNSYHHQLERLVTRRIELCEWVARAFPETNVHLFGLAHPSELPAQLRHPFVQSIDTSLPVMAAARGIRYQVEDFGPYEKYFLDLSLPYDKKMVELAQHNLRVMTGFWLSSSGVKQ